MLFKSDLKSVFDCDLLVAWKDLENGLFTRSFNEKDDILTSLGMSEVDPV